MTRKRTGWSNELALEVPMMDRSHRVILSDLSGMASLTGEQFVSRFTAMVGDLERDFFVEDEWMERIAFAETSYHREQHATILGALHRTHAKVMSGDIEFGRIIIVALSAWLADHIATMDLPLACAIRRAGLD